MDTCLVLTEVDRESCEAGLKKVRKYLQQYSFTEFRYSNEDGIRAYKKAMASNEKNWTEYMRTGSIAPASGSTSPYTWMRFSGLYMIGGNEHSIELFLYPVSQTRAVVAVGFGSSIFDAIYSYQSPLDGVIDLNVKEDFIALLLLIVTAFSPEAFALKTLMGEEDYALHLKAADIRDWLVAATPESIRRWRFQLVGIRAQTVDRGQIERRRSTERLTQTSSGYLIYELIAVN